MRRASVTKEFVFHAAHKDKSAPGGDQCGRLHGHTYVVWIKVTGQLNERDMVVHGDTLKEIYKKWIEPWVEHQYLNHTMQYLAVYADDLNKMGGPDIPVNPTMENLAWRIYRCVKACLSHLGHAEGLSVKVTLWETPTMFCEVGEDD